MTYFKSTIVFLFFIFITSSFKNIGKEDLSFYHAKLYYDNVLSQNQYYSYKKDEAGVEYFFENGKFIADSTILATAYIEFENNKYRLIEINYDNGSFSSEVQVKLEGDRYVSYNKGKRRDSFMLKDFNLFSGPNPIFDYLNARIIKSVAIKRQASDSINLIGIINGSLSKSDQTFLFGKDLVEIDKAGLGWKSKMRLSNSNIGISEYLEKQDSFVFLKTEKSIYHKEI